MKLPLSIVALMLCAAVSLAPQEQPLLRVTSRLVQVSVVVQGRGDQPVTDLIQDDFTLLEDGKPQKIAFFAMQSVEQLQQAGTEPQSPNFFTNHMERRGGAPTSLTVILLDALNTGFSDQEYARKQLLKFFLQLKPHDRVAIYSLRGGLRVVHDFTSNTASLVRALSRHSGQHAADLEASNPEPADTGIAEADELLNAVNQMMAEHYTRQRVRRSVGAVEAIAHHLHRLPGRKNLIWVSAGFPPLFEGPQGVETFSDDINRAVRAINNAGIAIYPVDARGLVGAFEAFPDMDPSRRARPGMVPRPNRMIDLGAMHEVADRTGGRVFMNTNDISGAIRRAIDDSRVTYTLGYYPTHGRWDGKYHEIKVRVRRAGTRVRHRSGYYAYSDDVNVTQQERDAALAATSASPLEATSLGLAVHVLGYDPGSTKLRFEIGLSPSEVRFAAKDGRWHAEMDAVFVQTTGEGKRLTGTRDTIHVNFAPARYQEAMKKGLLVTGAIDIEKRAEHLRIVIRDAGTNAAGSITIPLGNFAPNRKSS